MSSLLNQSDQLMLSAVLQLRDAIPGKAKKMAQSRNRGPEGDGRRLKTSSAVPGQN